MVGNAQRAIGHAAADDDDFDIGMVIADVVANLFQAAQCRKIRNRIGDRDVARHRHAAGDTGHVLFGDAAVDETVGKLRGERLDFAISDIRQNHVNAAVAPRCGQQLFVECLPHRCASTSRNARSKSSSVNGP
ncbi:hypothetical protein SDC9_96016 [bioreactor metagenome]|uniref:Uncharacterized protein n=1 Tax=bioreactor metagenome TaxID=1076179 RepID=A0A645A886_9ZZZZ